MNSTRMGTNTTDTYEDHCHEIEHPDDDKEGSGDNDEEGEGDNQ